MTPIDKVISTIHSDYKPEARYLKRARIDDSKEVGFIGCFEVLNSVHLLHPIEHVAISEIALCISQFHRVLAAKLVESGYVKEWGKLDFTKWNPSKLGDEGLVIVHEEITFKDVITPGKFSGSLWLDDERRSRNGNYHVNYKFEFGGGKHFGELRVCFIPEIANLAELAELQAQ